MARRVIARITADTTAVAGMAPETAETPETMTPELLPSSTGEMAMCCWCWFEQTHIRSLPAGVDDQTCARHVADLDEQRLQRSIERLRLEAETAETEETAETLAALKTTNKIAREPT